MKKLRLLHYQKKQRLYRSKAGSRFILGIFSTEMYSLAQVAEQLGCSQESIRRWKEAALRKVDPELAARIELEEDENKRLRKEVANLKLEIEILKKAAAYFAKETL